MQAVLCAYAFIYNFIQIYLQIRIAYYNSTQTYIREYITYTVHSVIYMGWFSCGTITKSIEEEELPVIGAVIGQECQCQQSCLRHTDSREPLTLHRATKSPASLYCKEAVCPTNSPIPQSAWISGSRGGFKH